MPCGSAVGKQGVDKAPFEQAETAEMGALEEQQRDTVGGGLVGEHGTSADAEHRPLEVGDDVALRHPVERTKPRGECEDEAANRQATQAVDPEQSLRETWGRKRSV